MTKRITFKIDCDIDLLFWHLVPSVNINLHSHEIEFEWLCIGLYISKANLMEQKEFRSVGRQYRNIAGKRYRIPRKAKKRFKANFCKRGWDIKKLKFSYKQLNRDVDGKRNN